MRSKKKSKNLHLVFLFFAFIFLIILTSFAVKGFLLIKNSKFDGEHRYIVAFMSNNETKVVSFSPQNKSISILKVDQKTDNLARYLEVPIDGVIFLKSESLTTENIPSTLFKLIFSLGSEKDLTKVDLFRLFIFSRGISTNSVSERELSEYLNESQKSTISSLTFTDPSIYSENLSIQIVNATNISGLGGRLAQFITNMGGNVVLVSTGEKTSVNSKITYFPDESYTAKKISYYLNFPLEKADRRGVADVIITIGKDKLYEINNKL